MYSLSVSWKVVKAIRTDLLRRSISIGLVVVGGVEMQWPRPRPKVSISSDVTNDLSVQRFRSCRFRGWRGRLAGSMLLVMKVMQSRIED